jgi:hypothetical protein
MTSWDRMASSPFRIELMLSRAEYGTVALGLGPPKQLAACCLSRSRIRPRSQSRYAARGAVRSTHTRGSPTRAGITRRHPGTAGPVGPTLWVWATRTPPDPLPSAGPHRPACTATGSSPSARRYTVAPLAQLGTVPLAVVMNVRGTLGRADRYLMSLGNWRLVTPLDICHCASAWPGIVGSMMTR